MLFSPQLAGKRLSDLCHRLATSLAAGIDLRKVWKRETENAPSRMRPAFRSVQQAIDRGEPFAEALRRTGKLFPPLFLEMVGVGERTGQTSEVLAKLERHYRVRHELTRTFLGMLAWPMFQLTAAVLIVGLLIWIFGVIGATDLDGKPIDILGLGLVGTPGLIAYLTIVGLAIGGVALLVTAARRGAFWMKPVQRFVTRLPGVGPAVQNVCLAQLSWALHLLLNVDMDLRHVVPLVLRATGNDFYIQHTDKMVKDVADGMPLHLAFANSLAFPPTFLDALAVAEESGQISESMARLTRQYEGEAETAMKWLSVAAGTVVWLLVAGLVILMIFRLFMLYLGTINDALNM